MSLNSQYFGVKRKKPDNVIKWDKSWKNDRCDVIRFCWWSTLEADEEFISYEQKPLMQ